MPFFLSNRQPDLTEQMDRNTCSPVLLENTYRQFSIINKLLSQWKRIYKKELRPLLDQKKTYTLLDIGFGGGDVPVQIAKWAFRDRIKLKVTAIDPDQRAIDFAKKNYPEGVVHWRKCTSTDLVLEKEKYDIVISNHLVHHLKNQELLKLLQEARELASLKVLFNDIERSDLGYSMFNLFSRAWFKDSFITEDGLTSIKRSFTLKELQELTTAGWYVERIFPFRLILKYDKT